MTIQTYSKEAIGRLVAENEDNKKLHVEIKRLRAVIREKNKALQAAWSQK